jgi:3-oxoadipate enol-lactonase/4-carboxymuconolactone decarboxylase
MHLDPDGLRVRREVLGDGHVDRTLAGATPFSARFQEFITRAAWGDIWARPGLERRDRSLVTLGALVAVRAQDELALHVRAAVRNGLTPDEIGEAILQSALYAGMPAANAAFKIAEQVLVEDGLVPRVTIPPL